MKKKLELFVARKIFHIFLGLFIIILIYLDILSKMSFFILTIIFFFTVLLMRKYKIPLIDRIIKLLEKKEEREFPGKAFFLFWLGSFIVYLIFPKNIALASIMILTIGDSTSALIGIFGKIEYPLNKRKKLEGIIAGIVLATIASSLFISLIIAFFASLVAMLIESVEKKINDNLLVPFVSAIVISLLNAF